MISSYTYIFTSNRASLSSHVLTIIDASFTIIASPSNYAPEMCIDMARCILIFFIPIKSSNEIFLRYISIVFRFFEVLMQFRIRLSKSKETRRNIKLVYVLHRLFIKYKITPTFISKPFYVYCIIVSP